MYNYDLARKRIIREFKKEKNMKYSTFRAVGIFFNKCNEILMKEVNKIFEDLNIVNKIYLGKKTIYIIDSDEVDIFFKIIDLNTMIKMFRNIIDENIDCKISFSINNDILINQVSDKTIKEIIQMLSYDENGIYLNKNAYRKIIKDPKNSRLWFNEVEKYYNCDVVFDFRC